MVEWLNTPGPYVQYTYDVDPKLSSIIQSNGFAFDDTYWYWHPRRRNRKTPILDMIKRAPLWTYPCRSVPAEKSRKRKADRERGQRKLELEAVLHA